MYKVEGPQNDLVLLPLKYAAELGNHPGVLSFGAAIHDFWVSRYTTWRYYLDDTTGRSSLARMKQDATNVVAHLDNEARIALVSWASSLTAQPNPSPADKKGWVSIAINPSIRPAVNQMFGRTLVGEPLCRDAQWKEASSGLGIKMMLAARDLRSIPSWLRPLACHFIPTYRSFMTSRETLCRLMMPIIVARCKDGDATTMPPKSDAVQYMIGASDPSRAKNVTFQLGQIFDYIFAGDNQIVNAVRTPVQWLM